MSKIRILDPATANRIAAGEVVERPASVVKELLENALDAGATRVAVILEEGGRGLVRVEDDGEGMDRDDALLALERHATSKIRKADELFAVATLGFRGEALPSIAAVSRLLLRTRDAGSDAGTEVRATGGKIESVKDAGLPVGTAIEIRDLFFNLPARRKFLRAPATELQHALRVAEEVAMARPGLRLRVTHQDRLLLDLPPDASRMDRLLRVHGGAEAEWLPFGEEREGLRAEGFLCLNPGLRARGRPLLLWVNGRPVADRILQHALREGYASQKGVEAPGLALLFLTVPPDAVDVNVHPTKAEVRFRDAHAMHEWVRGLVARGLRREAPYPEVAAAARPAGEPMVSDLLAARGEAWRTREEARPSPRPLPEADAPVPLAQYDESYVVGRDARGLLVADQHAAHERVLYEQLCRAIREGKPARQALLQPVTLEVPAHEAIVLREHLGTLARFGFEVEEFGGNAFLVKAAPAGLEASGVAEAVAECARSLAGPEDEGAPATGHCGAELPRRGEDGRLDGIDARTHRLAASLACRAAIKIHHPLPMETMRWLLGALVRCESPMVCPHGRPTLLRWTHEEIERAFLRK